MKTLAYKLDKGTCIFSFDVNPENPFFAVRKVIVNYPNPSLKIGDIADLKVIVQKSESQIESYDVRLSNGMGYSLNDLEKYFKNFNDANIQKVTIELCNTCEDEELSVDLEIQLGRDLLDLKKPWQEFNNHISNPANTKIFFSAPFGQGKTTFLNEFFKQEKETYEVFRIFPVNYSVATNQDIFRYIKADLLYQLVVEKACTFEKLDASYLKTIPAFIKKNPDKILAPFLMLIPEVGKDFFAFYEKIKTVADSFIDSHDKVSVDDKKEIDSFLKNLIEQEGSIYEDNLLTQIIRQQIKSINTNKKSVLVIDDLDRLDPEHTFRILNIISAHYDSYEYSESSSSDYNKFGFDKIIVVCDIENVKNIFEHRYGASANFSGYINKFYSTSHFEYDNKKVMFSLIDGLIDFQARDQKPSNYRHAINFLFRTFISADQISLRDMLKLTKLSLKFHVNFLNHVYVKGRYNFKQGLCSPIISLLAELYNEKTLMSMIERCKSASIIISTTRMNDVCWELIAPIANSTEDDNKKGPHEFEFNSRKYELKLGTEIYTDRLRIEEGTCDNLPINFGTHSFRKEDFYNLLTENIRWYFSTIKLWQAEKNN